ncbi:preprotein translocase subunit SecG [Pseudooceanicola sediminis]|uniref:Protein-export membrane protein SecG n=1 Tax=Pseudooceanicola sediminis TaxID=2211117 RepID=A0A399IZF8_9RHOB|nr:preprotein translocase subunit SecG [Pseudooceanicola sediminis]KAA2313191.1 preprotein translocase subunit SecG [Puniceibacterium sp. HSS470]RII37837.1 preprotein translocase subunit SecG [Pseudooceanicola sediminis]|tara:strand:- start:52675 stop:53052 length:378 start_codon:yes stop_codon:yes gene_type:complete
MENVVLIIHLILALALIGVVLLQRSEGGGLGMGGGGGGGAISGRAAATALAKFTWIVAGLFICTSLALTIIAAEKSSGASVLDRLGPVSVPAPSETAPVDTPESGSLLPPPAGSSDSGNLTPSAD